MKDAESTPSPRRFCSVLGMRKAAEKGPAIEEGPKAWGNTRVRMKPASPDRRIPNATRVAPRAEGGGALSGWAGTFGRLPTLSGATHVPACYPAANGEGAGHRRRGKPAESA